MTATKTVVTISSLALAAMFGGGIYVLMNLGSIAEKITEKIASDTLGVTVTIGKMDVLLIEKMVVVRNLKVGNPAGYSGSHAATIENITLKADTLSQTLLKFNNISVTGSEVYLEVKKGGTNLTDIKKTVNAKAAKGNKAAQQIKVIIENMRIENMRVNPSVLLLGSKLDPIIVPDISLRGVGVRENGVLASEAIAQVWQHISKKVTQASGKAGYYQGMNEDALKEIGATEFERFKQQLGEDLDHLGRDLKKVFD